MDKEKKSGLFKKEVKISSYFAFLTSVLIAVIVILTMGYVLRFVKNISYDYRNNIKSFNYVVSSLVFQLYADSYNDGRRDYSKINKTTGILKANNLLSYAYAVDNHTNQIIWSTESNLLNKHAIEVNYVLSKDNSLNDIQEIQGTTDNYTVTMGLTQGKTQNNNIHIMFENMKIFVFILLFFGLLASAMMSRIINSPLIRLTKGVKEFAGGNFNYRLKETRFGEINELVSAYNTMAAQLLELYTSLEQKVQERTLELEKANNELKEAQAMMVHSEKMRSLGELVAGIAHEINNPINFIYGNIMILDKYNKDMFDLIEKYIENEESLAPEKRIEIEKLKNEIDIDFLKDDIKELIRSCVEGTERTKNIILDLKNFSRMEEMVMTQFDIPKEIDTTLNILNNKYKNRITVHKNYEENLPKIEAYGGQLNQVFMNILDNAAAAIEGNGDVYIDVKRLGDNVEIKFKDTGKGIKKENLSKVFDPFFTTKPVGQGTGLGMSISYRVIQNHYGSINVESEVGQGATFTIVIPINHQNGNNIPALTSKDINDNEAQG